MFVLISGTETNIPKEKQLIQQTTATANSQYGTFSRSADGRSIGCKHNFF